MDRNQGVHYDNYNLHWSLSARRAWIEIVITAMTSQISVRSLSARRAWIEIHSARPGTHRPWSLSARRAWIEILIILYAFIGVLVALRKESVDRNNFTAS